ncbi:MAG: hypothetical protein M1540_03160 [Candidatus Bathyarchaeota archaeon]|nr:hypothetical protein [Candidatus Bathyarchaeota archaeon]
MALSWRKWTKNDVLFGIIVPIIVVLLIVGISQITLLIGYTSESAGILIGITMEILELTIIVAVPLMLGLLWNQWAGGASGFIMGTFYALYWSNAFEGAHGSGTVLLGYVLSAMLIGYMAGALNKRSDDFRRMLISGVIATTIGGVMLFGIFQLSTANVVTGSDGFILTLLPRIAAGAIIPVLAKVFFWYGMGVNKKTNQ